MVTGRCVSTRSARCCCVNILLCFKGPDDTLCGCACARTAMYNISERFPFCPFKCDKCTLTTLFRQFHRRCCTRKDIPYIYNYKLIHTSRRQYARSDPRSTVQRFVVKSIFGTGDRLYSPVYREHVSRIFYTNGTVFTIFPSPPPTFTWEITHEIQYFYCYIYIIYKYAFFFIVFSLVISRAVNLMH